MDKKIKELFASVIGIKIDDLNEESSPKNTKNWDSLNHLVLIAAFEDAFEIDIEPEEIAFMFKNFSNFKSVVEQKLVNR